MTPSLTPNPADPDPAGSNRTGGQLILGIDPGLATIGFGCIQTDGRRHQLVDAGIIATPARLVLGQRLLLIEKDLNKIFKQLKPDVVVIEKLFFSQNVSSGLEVASCRGLILLLAYKYAPSVVEYSPNQVKLALVGFGHAPKRQLINRVQQILQLQEPPQPDDLADALALALVHSSRL